MVNVDLDSYQCRNLYASSYKSWFHKCPWLHLTRDGGRILGYCQRWGKSGVVSVCCWQSFPELQAYRLLNASSKVTTVTSRLLCRIAASDFEPFEKSSCILVDGRVWEPELLQGEFRIVIVRHSISLVWLRCRQGYSWKRETACGESFTQTKNKRAAG